MKQGQWVGGRIPLECIRKSLQTGRPNRPLGKHGLTYLATIIIVIIVTIISMIIITHHHHQSPFIIMRRHHQMDFKDKLAYRDLPSMVGIQADLTQANSITALSLPLHNVLFVQYVFLPTEQTETYFKICILTYDLTYICPGLFDWKENTFFFIFVYFKL